MQAMGQAKVRVRCTAYESPVSGRWIGECEDLGLAVEADNLMVCAICSVRL